MVGFADHLAPADLRIAGSRRTVAGDPSFSLAAMGTAKLPDGALVYVQSQKSYWQLDKDDTQAADNVTIVKAAQGPGNWLRLAWPYANGSPWLDQATWYINAVSGSDDNDGATAATALASHAEFAARLGNRPLVTQAITVNIMTDLPEKILMAADFSGDGSSIQYFGYVQSTDATDVVTAAQGSNLNLEGRLQGTAITDFTPYIGKSVVYLSGAANGFRGWITGISQAAAVNEIARVGTPTRRTGGFNNRFDWTTAPATPGPGDSFVIQTLATVEGVAVESRRIDAGTNGQSAQLGFVFSNLCIENTADTRTSIVNDARAPQEDGAVMMVNCAIKNSMQGYGGAELRSCMSGGQGAIGNVTMYNLSVSLQGWSGGGLELRRSFMFLAVNGCYVDTDSFKLSDGSLGRSVEFSAWHSNNAPGLVVDSSSRIEELLLGGVLTSAAADADGMWVLGDVYTAGPAGAPANLLITPGAGGNALELGARSAPVILTFAAVPVKNVPGVGGAVDDAGVMLI